MGHKHRLYTSMRKEQMVGQIILIARQFSSVRVITFHRFFPLYLSAPKYYTEASQSPQNVTVIQESHRAIKICHFPFSFPLFYYESNLVHEKASEQGSLSTFT